MKFVEIGVNFQTLMAKINLIDEAQEVKLWKVKTVSYFDTPPGKSLPYLLIMRQVNTTLSTEAYTFATFVRGNYLGIPILILILMFYSR